MINHARTLLHNHTKSDEYVSSTYVPKVLPDVWQQLHDSLYGDVDEAGRNYRTRQLMMLLHVTGFDKYIRELDPRITYIPWSKLKEPAGLIQLNKVLEQTCQLAQDYEYQLFLSAQNIRCAELHKIWSNSPVGLMKLCAIVMALIYKIGELNR